MYVLINCWDRNLNMNVFNTFQAAVNQMTKEYNNSIIENEIDADDDTVCGINITTEKETGDFSHGSAWINYDDGTTNDWEIRNISTPMTKEKALAAQRILMDNGIDADDTSTVLQALGATMFNEEWEDLIEWDENNIPYENSIWG